MLQRIKPSASFLLLPGSGGGVHGARELRNLIGINQFAVHTNIPAGSRLRPSSHRSFKMAVGGAGN